MPSTRWGDNLDIITTNASLTTLRQYKTVALLGDVALSPQLLLNVRTWVEEGGVLVVNANQLANFDGSVPGSLPVKSTVKERQVVPVDRGWHSIHRARVHLHLGDALLGGCNRERQQFRRADHVKPVRQRPGYSHYAEISTDQRARPDLECRDTAFRLVAVRACPRPGIRSSCGVHRESDRHWSNRRRTQPLGGRLGRVYLLSHFQARGGRHGIDDGAGDFAHRRQVRDPGFGAGAGV